jgi:hypothetical protein
MLLTYRDRLILAVAHQRAWIEACGGSLDGYVKRYGDPGRAPVDADGDPRVVVGDFSDLLRDQLVPVPLLYNTFYLPHFGDGGTAIWVSDCGELRRLVAELQYFLDPDGVEEPVLEWFPPAGS